eukprot:4553966-Prymnesium_polylepis.1
MAELSPRRPAAIAAPAYTSQEEEAPEGAESQGGGEGASLNALNYLPTGETDQQSLKLPSRIS